MTHVIHTHGACFQLCLTFRQMTIDYIQSLPEEERQQTEDGARAHYLGLPVTSAALIFPFVLLLQFMTRADITLAYIAAALLTGLLFLIPFRVKKPGLRGILIMVGIGALEFLLLLLWKKLFR